MRDERVEADGNNGVVGGSSRPATGHVVLEEALLRVAKPNCKNCYGRGYVRIIGRGMSPCGCVRRRVAKTYNQLKVLDDKQRQQS
jgi:hypothetical protein